MNESLPKVLFILKISNICKIRISELQLYFLIKVEIKKYAVGYVMLCMLCYAARWKARTTFTFYHQFDSIAETCYQVSIFDIKKYKSTYITKFINIFKLSPRLILYNLIGAFPVPKRSYKFFSSSDSSIQNQQSKLTVR